MGDATFLGHEPCPECGSSDNLGRWDDGHAYCFGCGHYQPANDGAHRAEPASQPKRTRPRMSLIEGEVKPLGARNLSAETCQKFDYRVGQYKGKTVQVANYKKDGQTIAQKVRFKDKSFIFLGETDEVGLYGEWLWKPGRMVVVTEGEIDALTVSQIQGNKWPVVSVPNGAQGAAKSVRKSLEFLEAFESVVFLFDQDEPGQEAAQECATLLSPGKAYIAHLNGKDPNEMLQEDNSKGIISAIWEAKLYEPDGILNGDSLWDEIQKPIEEGLSYPWQALTDLTYGIRSGEMIGIGSGTGMGKTDFMKEIETWLASHHQEKVGVLHLEESVRETGLSLMSKHAGQMFHLPHGEWTEEDKEQAFGATLGSGRVLLYDSFGYNDYDHIKSRIRYMAVAHGCKFIFLDHITALVTGDAKNDERKQLDYIMTDLASLVKELDITIFYISHLTTPESGSHEEGARVTLRQFRGSRAIGQWSWYVIGLERDQQEQNEQARHTSTIRILKDRYTGQATGKVFYLRYNPNTGKMNEVTGDDFGEEFEDETGGSF